MSPDAKFLIATALLAAAAGCNSSRVTSAGFSLPRDGDPERGQRAFVSLGCPTCHQVAGSDLPRPTVQPPVPVVLGGIIEHKLSDAYLVTAMIDPNHELAPQPKAQITTAGYTRMPPYADLMTVRQMVDIVAYLQAQYKVRPPEYGLR